MNRSTSALAALLALTAAGAAAEQVQKSRPADPAGRVQVENASGAVVVIGWDRPEVSVSGDLGTRAEGLAFTGGRGVTRIAVEVHGAPHGVHSRLEVRVPSRSTVEVEGFNTNIEVRGISGGVHAESVNGDIVVEGSPGSVEVETVNGEVSVTGAGGPVRASSVNGGVSVRGTSTHIEADTVNGRLAVEAAAVERAQLETVSGALRFEGGLHPKGRLDAHSVSGSVDLEFTGPVDAQFSVATFSGGVDNQLGPPARRTSEYTPEKELRFSVGSGTARVSVDTLSGHVRLGRR